jgi:integrase
MKVTYIERSPGTWRLRIETGVSPDGRRLFKYETLKGSLDDVQRRRFAILQAHEEQTWTEPSKVTFRAFFAHWIETRRALNKITRTTSENYEKIFRYFLQPLAGKRVQRITSQDVQAIYTRMGRDGVSEGTLIHTHKVVVACFHAIRRANLIKSNVMEEVEAPRRPRMKPKALPAAEAARLLTTLAGEWYEPIVALALATGLRRGEVLGLRWGDVDLDGGRIHVRGQLVQYANASIEWVETKTAAGLRTIAVDAETVDMLRRLRLAAGENRMAVGLGGKLDAAYVFLAQRGNGENPIKPSTLGAAFWRHCRAHGFADFSFHGTRHTHITALLARVGKAGAKAVSQRAGHANLSTTLGVYQTVFEEDDRALADLSSGLFKGKK